MPTSKRPEGEKYAELQRVRLGSRLPVYLPMRINEELMDILKEFKTKASAIGIKQFLIQTHFQTPLEVTPRSQRSHPQDSGCRMDHYQSIGVQCGSITPGTYGQVAQSIE